ncbi:sorting nexin-11 [Cyprinodon tularosa]|uniref:sorting nexin-11 n=1 Tax=Cyprinodon tularosa TaxID=77115 RepID=UPI0018E22BE0|nr:sorting nexin-11 [Cyprinodon tularosa]
MISNHEEDEFVAVRVQDPRIQNEGSWNSYVDYKIFLHTNSRAFTAKTSCVRRRYSEFEWLRKKLQKNAGLVPVPELPGKSFFSFNNEDFLEKRRRGLQTFLDKVVHTTVCLSDSQLHLFLQTQLPVGHILDCVQGLTPYTVTDAILTYASSNRGLAQAQQEDSIREPSLTVSYESIESPAPHQPSLQPNKTVNSKPIPDSDPLGDILELCEQRPVASSSQRRENALMRISEGSDQMEVAEQRGSTQASFYLGEILDDSESLSPAEDSCVILTPVEVHSAMGAGYEDSCEGDSVFEDRADPSDSEERKNSESEEVLSAEDSNNEEEVVERHVASEDLSLVCNTHLPDVKPGHDTQPESLTNEESESKEETIVHLESRDLNSEPEVDLCDSPQQINANEDGGESDEDSQSSNESIIRCSEEESLAEEVGDSIQMKTSPDDIRNWSGVEGSAPNIFYINGCNEEQEDASNWEGDDQQHAPISKSLEPKPATADGDPTESCDFSILESSCQSLEDCNVPKQEASASVALGGSEGT